MHSVLLTDRRATGQPSNQLGTSCCLPQLHHVPHLTRHSPTPCLHHPQCIFVGLNLMLAIFDMTGSVAVLP